MHLIYTPYTPYIHYIHSLYTLYTLPIHPYTSKGTHGIDDAAYIEAAELTDSACLHLQFIQAVYNVITGRYPTTKEEVHSQYTLDTLSIHSLYTLYTLSTHSLYTLYTLSIHSYTLSIHSYSLLYTLYTPLYTRHCLSEPFISCSSSGPLVQQATNLGFLAIGILYTHTLYTI
jgi:hypothetical protein